MDFEPSEEQRMALDGWRRAVERDVAPLAREFRDRAFTKPAALHLMKTMVPYGVGSGWVPDEAGGMGLDFLTSGLLFEELSKVSPDAGGIAWVAEGAALKVHANGSEAIKARYLPKMLAGEIIGCSAISEPGIGSSVREMRTRAVRDGKYFRISGEKMWTSNATVADVVVSSRAPATTSSRCSSSTARSTVSGPPRSPSWA
jgi:alkylation response protein AidB-like acyl-CoA dehydrogenase